MNLYEERLADGSPKKWKKGAGPRALIPRFFIGLVISLMSSFLIGMCFLSGNPTFVLWFFIALSIASVVIFSLCCLYSFKKHGKLHERPNSSSSDYGIHPLKEARLSMKFRLIYSGIFFLLIIPCIVLWCINLKDIVPIWFSEESMSTYGFTYAEIARGLNAWLGFATIFFLLIQLQGVWCFGNQLRRYACPKCGYVNSACETEVSDYYSHVMDVEVQRVRGTSGGKTKVGEATVDGKTVDVYGYTSGSPGYTVYETHEFQSWTQHWKCCKCGRTWSTEGRSSKKVEGTSSYTRYDY